MYSHRTSIFIIFTLACHFVCSGQQGITSIVTTNSSTTPVSRTNVKGAGLRNNMNQMSSNWDSTGTSFTVNYSATANNIRSITQFTVTGHTVPFIIHPTPTSFVRVRRSGNSYVNDARNHFNYWSVYSSLPANNATSGTYNLLSPEITSAEAALISNNINSGYDNIFQNTISNLHSGNIERLDFIIPGGITARNNYDLDNAGPVVFDRGNGDPFKIALITSVDASNNPLTYGPMILVSNSHYGTNLLAAAFNYCILVHDPKFGTRARPSTTQAQNIRGVFFSLADLGLSTNQKFYGYSLFGDDVVTAAADWNTYPTNSNANSQLDPINVMGIFKDANSALPVDLDFELAKKSDKPLIRFTAEGMTEAETITIERSENGRTFSAVHEITITETGSYQYQDMSANGGILWYRLRSTKDDGSQRYSSMKSIQLGKDGRLTVTPNPARNEVYIILPDHWKNGTVSTKIYDASGAIVQSSQLKATELTRKITMSHLKSGTYYVQLTNEITGQTETKQILKL